MLLSRWKNEAIRGRGRHEFRFRLHQQRKLRFVETLHKEQVAGNRDHGLASRRELIHSSVGGEKCRAQSDPGVTGQMAAIAFVFTDVLQ